MILCYIANRILFGAEVELKSHLKDKKKEVTKIDFKIKKKNQKNTKPFTHQS